MEDFGTEQFWRFWFSEKQKIDREERGETPVYVSHGIDGLPIEYTECGTDQPVCSYDDYKTVVVTRHPKITKAGGVPI